MPYLLRRNGFVYGLSNVRPAVIGSPTVQPGSAGHRLATAKASREPVFSNAAGRFHRRGATITSGHPEPVAIPVLHAALDAGRDGAGRTHPSGTLAFRGLS